MTLLSPTEEIKILKKELKKIKQKICCLAQIVSLDTYTESFDLSMSDAGEFIMTNNPSANTVGIPLNSDVSFEIGTEITIFQYGAGQTTISPAVGVTVRSVGDLLSIGAQYGAVTLVKIATDEWLLIGNLA